MTLASPQLRRWTRDEYLRMADRGVFEGQHVQLIDGEIIQMAPQGSMHAFVMRKVSKALTEIFEPRHWIRNQLQLDFGRSQPEPDIAVAEKSEDSYRDHHPKTALLVVEINDSSLRLDRKKANLHASAGIAEYWLVNLEDQSVTVYRKPTRSEE